MKIPNPSPLVNKFLAAAASNPDSGTAGERNTVERLVTGIIFLDKPSPNKIHEADVTGESKRAFYDHIHDLAQQMPSHFRQMFSNLQGDPKIAMNGGGFLIIDEHVIPHSSKHIEGVDKFYSTTERGVVLGMSLLAVHYYSERVDYPVDFDFYRRYRELEARGDVTAFEEKNQLARQFFTKFASMKNAPDTWLMDSYFMTKENGGLLQHFHKTYISRPKRNWNCNYQGHTYSLYELHDHIPAEDFKLTQVKNPKTGKRKFYHTATVDVYFARIGTHRLVLVQCGEATAMDEVIEGNPEILEAPSKNKFRVFVTNNTSWDASYILSTYSLRWSIETSFQGMNQNLALHGCKWRELSGQKCFLALTFMCYLFLSWARVHGELEQYGVKRGTLGQSRRAFRRYCVEQFAEWLTRLKQQCTECAPADYIYAHLYDNDAGK